MDRAKRNAQPKMNARKGLSLFSSLLLMIASSVVLLVVVVLAALLTLPDVRQLEKCMTTSMFQVHLCPGSENYATLKEISPYALHAVIASEDGAFYSHDGFDWHEMEESLTANLRSGKIRRGGSTLTQQLAKNVFLDKEKSLWRKLKEAYLAHAIERHYTKDFILEKYMNVVEFGPGLYGIKPAAQRYFHKSPSELNPLEGAYLAFLLPNPKVYSKSFATGKLTPFGRKIVGVILKRMESFGKLSPAAYQTAIAGLSSFPWSSLSRSSFQDSPGYSLEATMPKESASESKSDSAPPDEETVEEMIREEEPPTE